MFYLTILILIPKKMYYVIQTRNQISSHRIGGGTYHDNHTYLYLISVFLFIFNILISKGFIPKVPRNMGGKLINK